MKTEEILDVDTLVDTINQEMVSAISACKKDLQTIRTGRPTPDIINTIKVEAYGAKTQIMHIGNISVPDSRTLVVNVWDKNLVSNADTAIREAGLGFNPIIDGTNLKIHLPLITEDRRKELIKLTNKISEEFKIEIRRIRRNAIDKIKSGKSNGTVSEDDLYIYSKKIDDITAKFTKEVDELLHVKHSELERI